VARAVAQQPTAVNGQDERFAPLTAAARRAFWQTRRVMTTASMTPSEIAEELAKLLAIEPQAIVSVAE